MWLIDLDEYRPGPFVVDADRLPGSRRYMAPEEHVRGATIDERTTVHLLGRTMHHLLDCDAGWRASAAQRAVVDRACAPAASGRYTGVAALGAAWFTATAGASVPNRRPRSDDSAEALLLGRETSVGFAGSWPQRSGDDDTDIRPEGERCGSRCQ